MQDELTSSHLLSSDNLVASNSDNIIHRDFHREPVLSSTNGLIQQQSSDRDYVSALETTNYHENTFDNDADNGLASEEIVSEEDQPEKLKVKITRTVKTTKVSKVGDQIFGVKSHVKQGSSIKQKELIGSPGLGLSSSSARSLTSDDDVKASDSEQQLDQETKLPVRATTTISSTTTKPGRVIITKPNGIFSLVNNKPTIIPASLKSKSRSRNQDNKESSQSEEIPEDN